MCGIFGFSGQSNQAGKIVLQGIKRLDYRGYDSWGVAAVEGKNLWLRKDVGLVPDCVTPESYCAIAHTRWATTGAVSALNAHPHFSTDKSFALVQNGIVENYQQIKNQLLSLGYQFVSQTDTEVIVRLIEDKQKNCSSLRLAITAALEELVGRNTILVITSEGQIFGARNGSPLVIGKQSKTGDIFLSSDVLSFNGLVDQMMVVDNQQLVEINHHKLKLFNLSSGKEMKAAFHPLVMDKAEVNKGDFPHFMLKEIHEGPQAILEVTKIPKTQLDALATATKQARQVYTIGSGGAGVAAAQVAFYLRSYGNISATSLIGANAIEYGQLFNQNDLIIAISQSGETADVLEVLDIAKSKGVTIASFVNMPGSMMAQISDYALAANSGPEICVMSTKTFDAQIAFGYLLAQTIAGKAKFALVQLQTLVKEMTTYLADQQQHFNIEQVALSLLGDHDIFLLGKYSTYHIAREGMIKIIEATYKHGHALPAGDLKHYVITLMEEGVSVITLVPEDQTRKDMFNAIDQVRLRGAKVIGISSKKADQFDQFLAIPECGQLSDMMSLVPLQLLAYYLAKKMGNSIDKPRHIAKSVTVK